ncbi:MAG: HAD hydrolase family protein, partial [Vicinamibacterales bacterium]
HEQAALDAIRTLGLELQVIFNKGAVMILPSGENKATGLCAALEELCLSAHNVVGIGDAENDHALLEMCELSVAVANAIPSLQTRADIVTVGARGTGVQELIERLLREPGDPVLAPPRHRIPIGRTQDEEVAIDPHGRHLLVSGPSGAGKSTLTNTLLEQLADRRYQFCLLDPEGDYEGFTRAIRIGTPHTAPSIEEVAAALQRPDQNVIVSLTGVARSDRPAYFASLLPRILELRAVTARPHWLVIDEAHHVLPADWQGAATLIPQAWSSLAMVTLEPDRVSPLATQDVDLVVAVGEVLPELSDLLGARGIHAGRDTLPPGTARLWRLAADPVPVTPVTFDVRPPVEQHRRHRRKYVEGSLTPETQFVFTGPEGRLRLTAQNLSEFMRLAEGVDEETWNYHLRRGDFSEWFRHVIKDEELADVVGNVESQPAQSRVAGMEALRRAIEERYSV